MCQDNSSTHFCRQPIAAYTATKSQGRKPQVKFCGRTSGTILLELVRLAQHNTIPTDKPDFHTELNKSRDLQRKCGVKYELHSAYPTIILPAFRNHVKWVQNKARLAGALIQKDDGCWGVGAGWLLKSEDEAVKRCEESILSDEGKSVSGVGTAKPFTSTESVLSSFSRTPGRTKPALSDLDHTSFGDGEHRLYRNEKPARSNVDEWLEQQEPGKSQARARMETLADKQMEHLEAARELDQQLAEAWKQAL